MEFELRHVLTRPPDAAFALLTTPAFEAEIDRRLALEKTLLERRETDDGWVRVWRVVERNEKPAFVQKIVGSAFEYTLEHRVERSRRRLWWKVTPMVAADRVRAEGFEAIEDGQDPTRAVRIVRGVVEVDAPVFGRRLADFIGEQVRRGYERSLPFVERYVVEADPD